MSCIYTKSQSENLKEGDHSGDQGLDTKIILKWVIKRGYKLDFGVQ
jgi:hypothetical protein